jgi:predicted restriction endonuclease
MSSNSERVKRWRERHKKLCPSCHKKLIRSDSMTCNSCSRFLGDITIEQAIYKNLHKSSAFALIRNRARSLYRKDILKGCVICGYTNHVEVCHIKPISDFPMNTLISVVNHRNNIVALCPNHHWEFDHHLINLKG